MLLALRSLWEAIVAPQPPPAMGGGPGVNFAKYYDLKAVSPLEILNRIRRGQRPALALALLASGQIDNNEFAALLAASREDT